jgi:methylthioribose-1-phosphate isomerase
VSHTCPTLRRDGDQVVILDQTRLPWKNLLRLDSLDDAAAAIRDMQVRGAPLIGAAAAFGMALALRHDPPTPRSGRRRTLRQTRPTAVNLHWALDRMLAPWRRCPRWYAAGRLGRGRGDPRADAAANAAIGQHGLGLLRQLALSTQGPCRS